MDWSDFPLTLNAHHVAEILGLHVKTIQKRVERGSPLIPHPAFLRPYRWRRDEVKRWYETASVEHQRRELARAEREMRSA